MTGSAVGSQTVHLFCSRLFSVGFVIGLSVYFRENQLDRECNSRTIGFLLFFSNDFALLQPAFVRSP
jgi:hypothetical protein